MIHPTQTPDPELLAKLQDDAEHERRMEALDSARDVEEESENFDE